MTPGPRRLAAARLTPALLALDAVLIIAFAAAGRDTHASGMSAAGILSTAAPFLAAWALSWAGLRAWRAPFRLWPTGIGIWLGTVAGGLFLRWLAGGGVAFSFQLVTLCVLGAFLLLPRLLGSLALRRKAKHPGAADVR